MSGDHKHPNYMLIFGLLALLTVLEIGAAFLPRIWSHPNVIPITIVLLVGMALVKAGLVGAYFMHLRFEKPLFVLIVTAPLILAVFIVCMLLPDVAYDGLDLGKEGDPPAAPPAPAASE